MIFFAIEEKNEKIPSVHIISIAHKETDKKNTTNSSESNTPYKQCSRFVAVVVFHSVLNVAFPLN